jgi:hypothetical protein
MNVKAGERFRCQTCGSELLVLKPPSDASATLGCCSTPVVHVSKTKV